MTLPDMIRPGYKQSEVGVIPEDWGVAPIVEVSSITTGSRNTQDRVETGVYPFFVRSQTIERINSYAFDGEAVLTAGDGVGTGKVFHYINGKFDLHQRVYQISNFSNRLNGFFFYVYFSNRFFDRIMSMTAKSSVDSVRREMIADMLVPLPPPSEQRAIAEALSDADALIAALEAMIAKKRDLKQAAMQQLLTGKTRLPGFSGEWEVKRLSEVAEITKGAQLHSSRSSDEGEFPHYNGGVSPSGYTNESNCVGGTVAISEGGNSCGFVHFIESPFWCGGHCYALSKCVVENSFLYQTLKSRQSEIMALRVGSGLPNVQKASLAGFSILVPPTLVEQTAISEALSDMDADLALLEACAAKARAVKQGMMQELLTGKVRLV